MREYECYNRCPDEVRDGEIHNSRKFLYIEIRTTSEEEVRYAKKYSKKNS